MAFKKKTAKRKTTTAAKKPASKRRRPVAAVKKAVRRGARRIGVSKVSAKDALISAALGAAGAIAVSFGLNHVPKKPDGSSILPAAIVPFAPILAGLGVLMVPSLSKNKMIASAAQGALVVGAVQAVKHFVPTLNLAGESDGMIIPPELEQAALLGYNVGSQGIDLGDDFDEMSGEISLGDDEDDDIEMSGEISLGYDNDAFGDDDIFA